MRSCITGAMLDFTLWSNIVWQHADNQVNPVNGDRRLRMVESVIIVLAWAAFAVAEICSYARVVIS